jgi:hypothetical protein
VRRRGRSCGLPVPFINGISGAASVHFDHQRGSQLCNAALPSGPQSEESRLAHTSPHAAPNEVDPCDASTWTRPTSQRQRRRLRTIGVQGDRSPASRDAWVSMG